jgi:hypothetical protein
VTLECLNRGDGPRSHRSSSAQEAGGAVGPGVVTGPAVIHPRVTGSPDTDGVGAARPPKERADVTTAARETAAPRVPAPADARHVADRSTQRRRRLRTACTLAGIAVRSRLLPSAGGRRRRMQVCDAANLLTALGVRVQVFLPPTAWPRSGRHVVSDHAGWLGDLAVATAFRGAPVAPPDVSEGAEDTVCAVAVRYRLEHRDGYLPEAELPRTVRGVAAMAGLVVEVRCLPAVPRTWAASQVAFISSQPPGVRVAVTHRTAARRPPR